MKHRKEHFDSLFHEHIGMIIREYVEFPDDIMVTITKVDTSPDGENATISITVLPDDKRGTALETLRTMTGLIRKELSKTVSMRVVPKIRFIIDSGEVYAEKINTLLNSLNDR